MALVKRFVRFAGDEAVNVPSADDVNETSDNKDALRWKANLSEKAWATFEDSARSRKHRDWVKLVYNSTTLPEAILGRMHTTEPASEGPSMGDDDFFTSANSSP